MPFHHQQPPTTLLTTAEPTTVATKKPARTNRRQKQHQTSVAPHVTQVRSIMATPSENSEITKQPQVLLGAEIIGDFRKQK